MEESVFNGRCQEFARDVQSFLEEHEAEIHGGAFCADERGNLLAWLAHRMGFDGDVWVTFVERLAWYTAQHQHEHGAPDGNGRLRRDDHG